MKVIQKVTGLNHIMQIKMAINHVIGYSLMLDFSQKLIEHEGVFMSNRNEL